MNEKRNKLIDVEIDEISAVDKAANLRTFLLLKQEGNNPLTPAQRAGTMPMRHTNADGMTTAEAAWDAVMARLSAIVASDWSGKSREQIFAQALQSDSELKSLYRTWQGMKDAPTEAMVDEMAKAMVSKGAEGSYFKAYAKILEDHPEYYIQIRAEQAAKASGLTPEQARTVSKSTAKTLKDAAYERFEEITRVIKTQNAKMTKYESIVAARETDEGRALLYLERDDYARLPVDLALEKIAKRDGHDVATFTRVTKAKL